MSTTHSSSPGMTPGAGTDQPDSTSEQARQTASQAASQAADEGRKVASTAGEEASSVAGEATAKARDLLDEAAGQLSDHSRSQVENLVGLLRSVGDDLQDMLADHQGTGVAADVVRQVADRAKAAGDRLDGREPGELLDEVRRLARQRPAVFLGGALVAGVLAGRLARGLKDSKGEGGTASSSPVAGGPSDALAPTSPDRAPR